jgi:hypothetical protein
MMLSDRPPDPVLARLSEPRSTIFIPEGASGAGCVLEVLVSVGLLGADVEVGLGVEAEVGGEVAAEVEEGLSARASMTPGSTRSLEAPTWARNHRYEPPPTAKHATISPTAPQRATRLQRTSFPCPVL